MLAYETYSYFQSALEIWKPRMIFFLIWYVRELVKKSFMPYFNRHVLWIFQMHSFFRNTWSFAETVAHRMVRTFCCALWVFWHQLIAIHMRCWVLMHQQIRSVKRNTNVAEGTAICHCCSAVHSQDPLECQLRWWWWRGEQRKPHWVTGSSAREKELWKKSLLRTAHAIILSFRAI